jgi:proteasome accessory factor C
MGCGGAAPGVGDERAKRSSSRPSDRPVCVANAVAGAGRRWGPGAQPPGLAMSTAARRGPRTRADRLRRLLVMLPWLMERGSASVAATAARFELSERDVVQDLELAAMCGLPPYVDELVDLFIDEGVIHVGVPRLFTRPLRLTAPEGFALLAAARSAMTLPGAEPLGALGRALDKLADALGGDATVVDVERPPAADELARAAAENARLLVRYRSAHRDDAEQREITARAVFLDRAYWYLLADDHRSGEERVFRLDRFEQWSRTGGHDPPRDVHVPGPGDWFADSDLPVAELLLGPEARWVADRYPVLDQHEESGGLVVRLAVTDESWLRVLLVRLGPGAEVRAPQQWRDLGADAAARLLARYDATGS